MSARPSPTGGPMRTDLCCAVALAAFAVSQDAHADSWRERFEVGLAPELTLVGLAGGARAQLAWLPGGPRSVSRMLLTPGFLVGPEFDYVPVGLGYRAVFRAGRVVRPLVGAGVEYQHRDVSDAPAARQLAVYLEGGSMFAVAPQWMVGAAVGMDVTVAGGFGFGLLGRAIVTWSFGSQR